VQAYPLKSIPSKDFEPTLLQSPAAISLPGFSIGKLLILAILLALHAVNLCASERNPVYREWLESYDGEFDKLKHTLVSYRNNRQANSGRERLASADLGGRSKGITGNYYIELGYDFIQGLDQVVASPLIAPGSLAAGGARYDPSGFHLRAAKRFFKVDRFDFHLQFDYHRAWADLEPGVPGAAGYQLPGGESVNTITGEQSLDFFNLDMVLRTRWSQRNRYSAQWETGLRFSDAAVKSTYTGVNNAPNPANNNLLSAAQDYHFRNIGVGPFVGVKLETPITRGVRLGLNLRQIYLPSKGKVRVTKLNRNAVGQDLVNTTNVFRDSTGFPITEGNLHLNWFFDHGARLQVGYAYRHWNFYETVGFGNEPFQDLTFHGPHGSIQYHF